MGWSCSWEWNFPLLQWRKHKTVPGSLWQTCGPTPLTFPWYRLDRAPERDGFHGKARMAYLVSDPLISCLEVTKVNTPFVSWQAEVTLSISYSHTISDKPRTQYCSKKCIFAPGMVVDKHKAQLLRSIEISISFYRCRKEGPERSDDFPKVDSWLECSCFSL